MMQGTTIDLARQYHVALPVRARTYLNRRGISDAVIDLHHLGWNGQRITIPVSDREGKLAFFRLAKAPWDHSDAPKVLSPAGAPIELYGWERVNAKPCRIIICEGEFDRLVLEDKGFAAVTSTGGAGVFRTEWAEAIRWIPEVYVCFDRDEAGERGAERVACLIPEARVVRLPDDVGHGGDVTDFFVGRRHSRDEFSQLLESARPLPPGEYRRHDRRGAVSPVSSDQDVDRLKASLAIEDVIGRYVALRPSGQTLAGRCPFHEDRRPSLAVYPTTRSFCCFGCQAHGDVLEFLMRVENLTFPEALEMLRRMSN